MNTTHALYRFWDANGGLLYIGITVNPGRRWPAHQKRAWWHDVSAITVETHPDRPAVLAAERTAINAEHPRHNVIHNRPAKQPRATASKPARGRDEALTPAEIRQIERALATPGHWGRIL